MSGSTRLASAAHCPVPAQGRQGTGPWSSPQRQLQTLDIRNQQSASSFVQRPLWSCSCSWESSLLLVSACHPHRQNWAGPLHLLLVVFGLQLCQKGKPMQRDQSAPGVKRHSVRMEKEIYRRRTCTACRVWCKMSLDMFIYFHTHIHSHTHICTHTNTHTVYVLCICTQMHTQKHLTKNTRNRFNMCFSKVKKIIR